MGKRSKRGSKRRSPRNSKRKRKSQKSYKFRSAYEEKAVQGLLATMLSSKVHGNIDNPELMTRAKKLLQYRKLVNDLSALQKRLSKSTKTEQSAREVLAVLTELKTVLNKLKEDESVNQDLISRAETLLKNAPVLAELTEEAAAAKILRQLTNAQ